MNRRFMLALTALVATAGLTLATTAAKARRIELSNQLIRLIWPATEKFRFTPNPGGTEGPEWRCPATLEGSFHSRTISKVCGQLLGYITRAALPVGLIGCELNNGVENAVFNGETLPWHILFISFTGVLPNIQRIRLSLRRLTFTLTVLGFACKYQATEARPAFAEAVATETTGEVNTFRMDETREIPLVEGIFGCSEKAFLQGTGNVRQLATTAKITIRLVQ